MKFVKQLSKGVSDYGPALRFIFEHKLAWFFLVPIALNILLFIGGFAFVSELSNIIQSKILDFSHLENAHFWGAEVLTWILAASIWLATKLLFFFLFAYAGGYIVLIFMSPILAYLSEKTERILTGHTYPFDIQQLMRDVVRGILIALRNLFLELLIILAVFIVSLFPLIGWLISIISPIFLVVVAAYFYGFSFTDYVNERQKLSVKESVSFMKHNKGTITGNGLPFAIILLIPIVGLLLSGFMAIIAVVASVISVKDLTPLNSNKTNTILDSYEKD